MEEEEDDDNDDEQRGDESGNEVKEDLKDNEGEEPCNNFHKKNIECQPSAISGYSFITN